MNLFFSPHLSRRVLRKFLKELRTPKVIIASSVNTWRQEKPSPLSSLAEFATWGKVQRHEERYEKELDKY